MTANVVMNKHADKLREAICKCDLGVNDFRLYVEGSDQYTQEAEEDAFESFQPSPINKNFTFDSFVVGPGTKFVYAAAKAVAENPGETFNPLFIYGESGLGKTHLMHAIANELAKRAPEKKVLYTTCENILNEFIDSIAQKNGALFRLHYRNVDVLMIDDVQFLKNKTQVQEELFHTFNELSSQNKQIVLTSDRPPKEIATLEERLRTRFESGLLADIQPPDLELRVAIIKKKAEQVGITIPENVLTYLAENIRSNIRQIEGAMKKLGAMYFLSGQEITIEVARACMADLLGAEEPVSVTVDKIFATVYKKYGIKKEDLIGKSRSREIAQARHVAIYLIRKITEMSLPNIGKTFNRDHTTVMSSYDIIEDKLKKDAMLTLDVNEMIKEITGESVE
jgi:chromosomal replication initiator protein